MRDLKVVQTYLTGFVDFPGRYSLTLAIPGCNLRCPFCYNQHVVHGRPELTLGRMRDFALRLKDAMPSTGIVFSGGEPTFHPLFPEMVHAFPDFPLALHTNGLLVPDFGASLFEYVVLSLKTPAIVGMRAEAYAERFSRALRFYGKGEVRLVSIPEHRQEQDEILALCREDLGGWKVRSVNPLEVKSD